MRIEHIAMYVNDSEKALTRTGLIHIAFSVIWLKLQEAKVNEGAAL